MVIPFRLSYFPSAATALSCIYKYTYSYHIYIRTGTGTGARGRSGRYRTWHIAAAAALVKQSLFALTVLHVPFRILVRLLVLSRVDSTRLECICLVPYVVSHLLGHLAPQHRTAPRIVPPRPTLHCLPFLVLLPLLYLVQVGPHSRFPCCGSRSLAVCCFPLLAIRGIHLYVCCTCLGISCAWP